jgi:L-fucose isomerase-like protein
MMDGILHADLGRATVVALPEAETERRWQATTPQWPIMHAALHGVSRDQMMARHKANHLNVAYGPSAEEANKALVAKAAMFEALGIKVHMCGDW